MPKYLRYKIYISLIEQVDNLNEQFDNCVVKNEILEFLVAMVEL